METLTIIGGWIAVTIVAYLGIIKISFLFKKKRRHYHAAGESDQSLKFLFIVFQAIVYFVYFIGLNKMFSQIKLNPWLGGHENIYYPLFLTVVLMLVVAINREH